jgi:hypothetical protein
VRINYDTEFLEDGRTIELISIALVADDGREYYAVNRDMPQAEIARHDWLMVNVWPSLPRLPVTEFKYRKYNRLNLDLDSPLIKHHAIIADEVSEFIRHTPDPELWAYYGAYDHVVLSQLWGRMIDHPAWVPMWTNDLKQEWARLGRPTMPEQADGEHNALADARHNKRMGDFLITLERQEAFLDLRQPRDNQELQEILSQLSPDARSWLGLPRETDGS